VNAFLDDVLPGEEWLQWGILAQQVAMALWDFDSWVTLSARYVDFTRASGALTQLSIALNARGMVATQCGDFATTTSLAAEKDVINDVTGIRMATACDLLLAGYRGRYNEANSLVTTTIDESVARGEGFTDGSINSPASSQRIMAELAPAPGAMSVPAGTPAQT
jgi:hypothetical protein